MSTLTRAIIIFGLLGIVVALPIFLRPEVDTGQAGADRELRIITPHNETIRREFGEAFAAYWYEKTGERVYVNWLTPGGTSEIRRVLDGAFTSAQERGASVGIDLFFGGGDYIFRQQARAEPSRLAPLEVFEKHPDWFGEEAIPANFTGETYYDDKKRWVGVCLSRFGICYNVDTITRLGIPAPQRWDDLSDPRYFGQIALTDPTKSGSVARAFEMLIQERIQDAQARSEADAVAVGWREGLELIQLIGANARYFTDSATKVPHDVAQGDSAAGMCIDFYGRTFNEMLRKDDGSSRLVWISPEGGTSTSVDPIAVLTGAPEPELAQEFVTFCLSERGQMLWNVRPGEKDGPKYRALRRMPVRQDLYTPDRVARFSDPDALPYETSGGFEYRGELTGRGFAAMRLIIRVMCIDSHNELKAAWRAIIDAGSPPEAIAVMQDLERLTYAHVIEELPSLMKTSSPIEMADYANELGEHLRANYEEARSIAERSAR